MKVLILTIFLAITISKTYSINCLGGGCGSCQDGNCDYNEPSYPIQRRIQPILPKPRFYPQPIPNPSNPCQNGRCNDINLEPNPYIQPTPCGGKRCNNYPPSPCRNGGCGEINPEPAPSPKPCETGRCNNYRPIPCRNGNCGEVNPQPTPCKNCRNDNNNRKTCSSCVRTCQSRCETDSCLNICLQNCQCEESEEEFENQTSCCDVLHPKNCFRDDEGNKRCFVRKHRECSDLCSSKIVSIQESENETRRSCTQVKNYPYVYCGNYEKHNCGQCASGRSGCSQKCRDVIPNNYYE